MSARHLAFLLAFSTLGPPFALLTWLGLWLDDLAFPGYRDQAIDAPLFLLGNFRSGTTFFHRLLARDRQTFTTTRLWEIMLAPSVSARRFWRTLRAVDRRLGGQMRRWLARRDQEYDRTFRLHEISLWAPEEDEALLLHIWSSGTSWMWAGLLDEMAPYVRFDGMSEPEKSRIMRFYQRCVRAHLYAHPRPADAESRPVTYLSKSPPFAGKVETLDAWFPDARFAYILRSPLQVVPSFLSMLQHVWRIFGVQVDPENACEQVTEIVAHWYYHPLAYLDRLPAERALILRFEDLVRDPRQTVEGLYEQYGLGLSPSYCDVLHAATERSREYKSQHQYDLENLGLCREEIVDRFGDLFDSYDLAR
jgi:hypothetical protein